MKNSIYNIYKKGENRYILLNTLSSATARIDEELKCLLEENPDNIPGDILKMFYENGFVVEDDCDERKILAHYFDKDRYNVYLHDLRYTAAMTYACNLACPYCYEGPEKDTETFDNERIDILLKNIDKNLSEKDFKRIGITLYGGEPLLAYHQCVKLMESVSIICEQQNKEFWGEIITNGVLITEEVVDTLLKPYCDWVQITMDGGRDAHNKRRIRKDGSGTYDTLLDVLELLRDADINFTLKLNVDRENADTFIELFRDLKDRGLEDIPKSFGWIYPANTEGAGEGCGSHARKCFSPEEMPDFVEKIREQTGEMRRLQYSQESLVIPKHIPCPFDREDVYVVDPYLDIFKCWEFLGQKDKKVGHIDKNGEMTFNYEYYEQMSRDPLEFEECRDCKYLPICAGGCAAQAYFENGTYHSSLCKKRKYSHQNHMEEYVDSILEQIM